MTDDSVVSISDVVSGTFGSPRASYYSGAERSSGAGGGSSMDVSEHSILGRGVFGVVYKDHLPVAVKKIRNYGLNAVKEVEVLKELSHVNIIRYYSHHTEDGGQNLCIIMEYADLGTLSSLIREEASDPESRYFMEKYNWRFLSQTSSALEYLHLKGILHRDLKPDNILGVTNKETGGILWKLGDFGLHRLLGEEGEDPFYFYAHTCCGTPNYMAPEVCYLFRQLKIFVQVWTNVCRYSFPADIWSLGCILMFRCSRGNHLFQFRREDVRLGMAERMSRWTGLEQGMLGGYSADLFNIMRAMLRPDYHRRPSASCIAEECTLDRMDNSVVEERMTRAWSA